MGITSQLVETYRNMRCLVTVFLALSCLSDPDPNIFSWSPLLNPYILNIGPVAHRPVPTLGYTYQFGYPWQIASTRSFLPTTSISQLAQFSKPANIIGSTFPDSPKSSQSILPAPVASVKTVVGNQ